MTALSVVHISFTFVSYGTQFLHIIHIPLSAIPWVKGCLKISHGRYEDYIGAKISVSQVLGIGRCRVRYKNGFIPIFCKIMGEGFTLEYKPYLHFEDYQRNFPVSLLFLRLMSYCFLMLFLGYLCVNLQSTYIAPHGHLQVG